MSHQPDASTSVVPEVSTTPRRTRPRTSVATDATQATIASPNRQKPRCFHCHRPREGHPRSGCPNVDPPIPPGPSSRRGSSVPAITQSLSAVQIEEAQQEVRVRFDLPASEDSEMPRGDESDDSSEHAAHESILHWRASVVSTAPEDPESPSTQPTELGPSPSELVAAAEAQFRVTQPVPLGRTMSEVEREEFLAYLAQTAKATDSVHVVRLAVDEIHENQAEADRLGFHGRVFAPGKDWPHQDDRVLVLGKSAQMVDMVYGSISARARATGRLPALAMAAFVGALGTWGALAFG